MSSDDSDFDKEAEREKLREKYGDDEKDRENTRRMSELLLQGATMTGKHCNRCGDPIFRYDGQEFCPTCQQEVQDGAGQQNTGQQGTDQQGTGRQDVGQQTADRSPSPEETAATESAEATDTTETPEIAEADADEAEQSDADDEPRVEIDGVRVAGHHADGSNLRQPPSQQDSGQHDGNALGRSSGTPNDHRAESTGDHPTGRADDLATARDALVRKLTDLARRAEETDDVARARDLLEATREAAEALAALDRANR